MKLVFAKPAMPAKGALIVGALEGRKLLATAQAIDAKTHGALKRALDASQFEGRKDQVAVLLAPPGLKLSRIVVIGLGKAGDVDELRLEAFGGKAAQEALASKEDEVALAVDAVPGGKLGLGEMSARIAFGARLRGWRFDRYMTQEKP
ncbi:MAG: leucyl aminopeptidase, partial [Rhodospirillales bacterium]